jgi:hypothetical protein
VLAISLGVGTSVMDDSVTMIRWRVERVELQGRRAGIDDVVLRPGRHENGEARADCRANPVENCFAASFLNTEELNRPGN